MDYLLSKQSDCSAIEDKNLDWPDLGELVSGKKVANQMFLRGHSVCLAVRDARKLKPRKCIPNLRQYPHADLNNVNCYRWNSL